MLLAIDVGNTNLVLALGSERYDGRAEAGYRIETASVTDTGSCEAAIRRVLGDLVEEIADAVIASVVPAVTPFLAEAVTRIIGTAPLVVGEAGVELGIGVNIDVPAQAGADRLVNAVGAMVSHELPAILLDFGTATTLDLVAADGTYEGGIIAPGVALSIEALERAAAQLPRLELRPFDADLPILGKNTVAAMETGVFWGYVGMIEGLLSRLRDEQGGGKEIPAIATGGLAGLFAEHLPGITAVDPDLTVRGLFEIYARNRGLRGDEGN